MDHRLSLGNCSGGSRGRGTSPRPEFGVALPREGSAINFPDNLCFRPSVAFKSAATSSDMEDRKRLLCRFTLMVKEEGPLGLASAKELKEVI
jgi:hypothetical protein